MGERKVLNKYYPPDFDATKLPRNRKPIDRQETVRTMLPMNIQCGSCGEFMYSGKKFNSKKELAIGEDYLTIKVWRFYIKCVMCSSEITFKTDPKNGNYIVERGARRNFEPWRAADEEEKAHNDKKDVEEEDAMKALENRQKESKREMDQMDALEELQAMSARHSQRTPEQLLALHQRKYQETTLEKLERQDEESVRTIFGDRSDPIQRRLDDDETVDERPEPRPDFLASFRITSDEARADGLIASVVKREKRKRPAATPTPPTPRFNTLLTTYPDTDSDS